MTIRRALTQSQKDAILSPASAKVLVEAQNAQISAQGTEIENLRANYRDLQNRYENIQKQYHRADKANGILSSKLEYSVIIEIIKYLLTAVGTGYGINVVTSGQVQGWLFVALSGVLYTAISAWQQKSIN